MKNTNYDNDLSMILNIARKSGMTLSHIGKGLGVARNTVSCWKNNKRNPDDPKLVLTRFKQKAKSLSRINLDNYDLNNLKEDYGMTFEYIAQELGDISRWGLSKKIKHNFDQDEAMKQRVQEILRAAGRRMLESLDY